ncbi:MAG: hypothetical protein WDA65_02750 [Christensenellales bacterium]
MVNEQTNQSEPHEIGIAEWFSGFIKQRISTIPTSSTDSGNHIPCEFEWRGAKGGAE